MKPMKQTELNEIKAIVDEIDGVQYCRVRRSGDSWLVYVVTDNGGMLVSDMIELLRDIVGDCQYWIIPGLKIPGFSVWIGRVRRD
jgi:hypothetical protein